jgi:hypothetical protein
VNRRVLGFGGSVERIACAVKGIPAGKTAIARDMPATPSNKALEVSPYKATALADEPDLNPLANLPAFKKLLPVTKQEP